MACTASGGMTPGAAAAGADDAGPGVVEVGFAGAGFVGAATGEVAAGADGRGGVTGIGIASPGAPDGCLNPDIPAPGVASDRAVSALSRTGGRSGG